MLQRLKVAYKALTTPIFLEEMVSAQLLEAQANLLAAEGERDTAHLNLRYAELKVDQHRETVSRLDARMNGEEIKVRRVKAVPRSAAA